MLARLGIVLYWFGCLLAVGWLAIGCLDGCFDHPAGDPTNPLGLGAVIAVVMWLIGCACRYVLAGR